MALPRKEKEQRMKYSVFVSFSGGTVLTVDAVDARQAEDVAATLVIRQISAMTTESVCIDGALADPEEE